MDNQTEIKETRSLAVVLTEEELRAKGLQLANKVTELDTTKQDLQDYQAGMKKVIKSIEDSISSLTMVVKSGKEYRDVECVDRHNAKLMTVETYRTDTWEMVETRQMSHSERQLQMFPPMKGETEKAEKAESHDVNDMESGLETGDASNSDATEEPVPNEEGSEGEAQDPQE